MGLLSKWVEAIAIKHTINPKTSILLTTLATKLTDPAIKY